MNSITALWERESKMEYKTVQHLRNLLTQCANMIGDDTTVNDKDAAELMAACDLLSGYLKSRRP